jgi:glycerophosphoryl diester phosphodiesterase
MVTVAAGMAAQNAQNPFFELMTKAAAHTRAHHGRYTPALSPMQESLLGEHPAIDLEQMHRAGFLVVPWTVDDVPTMRLLMAKHVDGIISDRPDLLMAEVRAARARAKGDAAELKYLDAFDAQGHRGGRGLRPENTLPAFEAGLDEGITSIETDTGVTTDQQSLIWHDQFLNPQSCRHADGTPYTMANRQYTRDISMADAQRIFVCDKLHFHTTPGDSVQTNDLKLSPVAVAFAEKEKMPSPYAPTYAAQLFRFVDFYAEYYSAGAGKSDPHAKERARTAARVHFNLETKIVPEGWTEAKMQELVTGESEAELRAAGKLPETFFDQNHTVGPEEFVRVLCGAIHAHHLETRADIQSFDFRTLRLVEEQYPAIRTYYLTESAATLKSDLVPPELR